MVAINQSTVDIAVTVPPVARVTRHINLLDYADAYWDAADAAGGQIPNRVSGGPPLVLTAGDFGFPIVYSFAGDRYLASGGWDDMWATAPLNVPDGGFVLRVDHDQDFAGRGETPPDVYAVVHQGTTDDLSWALRRHGTTGALTLVVSYDGSTLIDAAATDTPTAGITRAHLAVKVDTAAGTVEFYEQPATGALGRALTHRSWTQIGDTVTITPGDIHQSALDLSISGFDVIDDPYSGSALGAYHRLLLHNLDGNLLVDLDPALIDLPLGPWTVVDGYPDVGGVTTAKEAPFPGGAGETWTVHNFETFSYPVTVIDRPIVQLGNESYLTAAHDDLFDSDQITVAVCARSYNTFASVSWPFINHTDAAADIIAGGDTGWELGYRGGDVLTMAVGDGSDVRAADAPPHDMGDLQVVVGRLDTYASAFTDGVPGTPVTLAAFGALAVTAALKIGGGTGTSDRNVSLDVSRVAIFARALTDLEVAALTADMLAQP